MTSNIKSRILFILVLVFLPISIKAGEIVEIPFTNQPPVIDGKLDDPTWQTASKFTDFKIFKPDYKKDLSQKTEAFATHDANNFYFAMRCYETDPSKIKASVSKRDDLGGDDWVGVSLDTFNAQQNSFCFILNPLGIQTDGMINLQGNLDASLDMVWYSKGKINDQGYEVEFRIPLKSIRFPGRKKITMGLMFFRTIVRTSEQASFPMITPEGGGLLPQEQPVSVSGLRYQQLLEVLPAITHGRKSNLHQGKLIEDEKETDLSLTAKVGVTSDITLDGTYNPDFSQIEADAGQIDVNLRYQLYYPEKRPFFLEGKENFDFAGNTEDAPLVSLVHTRTIIDPILGLKLSGRIGKKSNFTTLLAIDESPGNEKDKDAYFSIFRYRQPIKNDNYIGAIYTGREFMNTFNRVAGVDGRLRLSNFFLGEFHALGSFTKTDKTGPTDFGHALALALSYDARKASAFLGIQDLGEKFNIYTGFLTRTNITRLAAFGMYRFYPQSKFFQRIEPFYWSFHIYDKEYKLWETFNLFCLRFWLPRSTNFRIDIIAANEVFAGLRFDTNAFRIISQSQITKELYFSILWRYGQGLYYDYENPFQGKGHRFSLDLSYQPLEKLNTIFSIAFTDFYRQSNDEKIYDYTIFYNRTTWQMNKYLFLRGITEYNTYRKKLTLDLLASFTYIPGTVIHLGYGSAFEKIKWVEPDYVSSDRFTETKRGLFFKISYLWRL